MRSKVMVTEYLKPQNREKMQNLMKLTFSSGNTRADVTSLPKEYSKVFVEARFLAHVSHVQSVKENFCYKS